MPAVFVVASAFLLWQVAGRQVWRRFHVDAENKLSVSLRELRAIIRHTPSLNASKEWYSMKDIPSIWMLLT